MIRRRTVSSFLPRACPARRRRALRAPRAAASSATPAPSRLLALRIDEDREKFTITAPPFIAMRRSSRRKRARGGRRAPAPHEATRSPARSRRPARPPSSSETWETSTRSPGDSSAHDFTPKSLKPHVALVTRRIGHRACCCAYVMYQHAEAVEVARTNSEFSIACRLRCPSRRELSLSLRAADSDDRGYARTCAAVAAPRPVDDVDLPSARRAEPPSFAYFGST